MLKSRHILRSLGIAKCDVLTKYAQNEMLIRGVGPANGDGAEKSRIVFMLTERDNREKAAEATGSSQRRPSYHTERCFLSCKVFFGRKKILKICAAISRLE